MVAAPKPVALILNVNLSTPLTSAVLPDQIHFAGEFAGKPEIANPLGVCVKLPVDCTVAFPQPDISNVLVFHVLSTMLAEVFDFQLPFVTMV